MLSDKEDDRGDMEITRPLRNGGERDSCGALRLVVGKEMLVGEKHTEKREGEDQSHDYESCGCFCCPALARMEGWGWAIKYKDREHRGRGREWSWESQAG